MSASCLVYIRTSLVIHDACWKSTSSRSYRTYEVNCFNLHNGDMWNEGNPEFSSEVVSTRASAKYPSSSAPVFQPSTHPTQELSPAVLTPLPTSPHPSAIPTENPSFQATTLSLTSTAEPTRKPSSNPSLEPSPNPSSNAFCDQNQDRCTDKEKCFINVEQNNALSYACGPMLQQSSPRELVFAFKGSPNLDASAKRWTFQTSHVQFMDTEKGQIDSKETPASAYTLLVEMQFRNQYDPGNFQFAKLRVPNPIKGGWLVDGNDLIYSDSADYRLEIVGNNLQKATHTEAEVQPTAKMKGYFKARKFGYNIPISVYFELDMDELDDTEAESEQIPFTTSSTCIDEAEEVPGWANKGCDIGCSVCASSHPRACLICTDGYDLQVLSTSCIGNCVKRNSVPMSDLANERLFMCTPPTGLLCVKFLEKSVVSGISLQDARRNRYFLESLLQFALLFPIVFVFTLVITMCSLHQCKRESTSIHLDNFIFKLRQNDENLLHGFDHQT